MYVYVNKESGENGEGERGRETLSVLADLFVKVSFERESSPSSAKFWLGYSISLSA
jgi:hypothetical protein